MEALELPFTIVEMSPQEVAQRVAHGFRQGQAVRTSPGNIILPLKYTRMANIYYNFKFRSDDVVVMSYPKSGSVWTREVVWALRNLDCLHLANQKTLGTRTFFIDLDILQPGIGADHEDGVGRQKECEEGPAEDGFVIQLATAHRGSPRVIATHLPFCLLNPNLLKTCKVVYVARNPKDVCLSLYNFLQGVGNQFADLSTMTEVVMENNMLYGPYWHHLQQAWDLRTHPNLHIYLYEDMKLDPMVELKKISLFLGLSLSQQQLQSVAEHTSLEAMKAREEKLPIARMKKGHSFYPGGRVGDWASAASQDLNDKMDAWIADKSRDIDIKFRYGIGG